jgi:hypothetical protein
MNEHITDTPADPSARITDRPAETRITLAPGAKARPWTWRRGIGVVVVIVAIWAFGVSIGWLPCWEADGPIDPDAVEPIDLPALLAQCEPPPADAQEIEESVEQLLDNIRHVTGKHAIALPTSFRSGQVQTGARIDLSHADGAILLASEYVRVVYARHCLIICPGVVTISDGKDNVIIAGQYIDVGSDGNVFGGLWGAPERSVLVCGRKLRLPFARDTICMAPDVHISHAHRVIFLHRRAGQDSHRWWCRDINEPPLLKPGEPVVDPLAGKVTLKEVRYDPALRRSGAMLAGPDEETEVVLAEDQTQPDGPLRGWKLVYCGNDLAVLKKKGRCLAHEWSLLVKKAPAKASH